MSRSQRVALLAAALGVLIVAFVVVRPGDDEEPGDGQAGTTMKTPAPPAVGSRPATPPPPPPRPDPGPLLTRGKIRTITVDKGEVVRFRARSSVPEEIHVHGYDILRDLPAGRTIRMAFKARIEGIFEIELERSGTQIGKLRVEP
jgi:hypothetical protein